MSTVQPWPRTLRFSRPFGFTLAELLIALAILGVIATFTIPKILNAQQNQKQSALAKEAASAISQAYQAYTLQYGYSPSFTINNLQPYLNYVAIDSTSTLDDHVDRNLSMNCASELTCLVMHGGGRVFWWTGDAFSNGSTTDAIHFYYDPDNIYSNTTADNPSKSTCFTLYYNGRVTSRANVLPHTRTDWDNDELPGNYDPSWFGWK